MPSCVPGQGRSVTQERINYLHLAKTSNSSWILSWHFLQLLQWMWILSGIFCCYQALHSCVTSCCQECYLLDIITQIAWAMVFTVHTVITDHFLLFINLYCIYICDKRKYIFLLPGTRQTHAYLSIRLAICGLKKCWLIWYSKIFTHRLDTSVKLNYKFQPLSKRLQTF